MPRSPKGRAAARGLDARLASNKLSCLLEMLHSKQLRSIKMLIDSNHGIYRGENLDPARMFMESLTTGPELENSQIHQQTL